MTPDERDLWFLPLGGSGEIGMNMNLYGHNGRWVMVDCGIGFDRESVTPKIIAADPQFIADRKEQLLGMVITHAHEDHIGAVPYLWEELRCPIYCTPFAAAVLERKLREVHGRKSFPLNVVLPGDVTTLGDFSIEWLPMTHSTPESQALILRTPLGTVLHTGDWKFDPDPLVGAGVPEHRLRALAEEGILAAVGDSTCATVSGWSVSEAALVEGLTHAIAAASGRVVVTCFGSNIARMQTIVRIALEHDRHVGLLGRSLHNNVRAARATGYWDAALPLIDELHLGYLPRQAALALATGSQGEVGAALSRFASGTHPAFDLEPGDTVIFSARTIPGNEEAIATLKDRLTARGVAIVSADDGALVHASGHPSQDELKQLYAWVQPEIVIPVHGETQHLRAHAGVAKACGVPRVMNGENGDLYFLAPVPGMRRGAAATGRRIIQR